MERKNGRVFLFIAHIDWRVYSWGDFFIWDFDGNQQPLCTLKIDATGVHEISLLGHPAEPPRVQTLSLREV